MVIPGAIGRSWWQHTRVMLKYVIYHLAVKLYSEATAASLPKFAPWSAE